MNDCVAMYRNKRADELTRDELIVAYTHAVTLLSREQRWSRQCVEMVGIFDRAASTILSRHAPQAMPLVMPSHPQRAPFWAEGDVCPCESCAT